MIPLKDTIPTRSFPMITVGFIVANIAAFFYQISLERAASEQLVFSYGAIPFHLTHAVSAGVPIPKTAASVFTSMFLHGDFLHLGGNMLYLWIFGNNVEDVMGHTRFVLFYFLCGVIAVFSHAWMQAQSNIPMIGASGAVSGILGAYLRSFPSARVITLVPLGFLWTTFRVPALIFIIIWFLGQIVNSLYAQSGTGGIAWFAHIGGFFAGLILISFFKQNKTSPVAC